MAAGPTTSYPIPNRHSKQVVKFTLARLLQVSPDGLLLQSSTVADVVQYRFAGGKMVPIARAYVEFVERKLLPQDRQVGVSGGMHTARCVERTEVAVATRQGHKVHLGNSVVYRSGGR